MTNACVDGQFQISNIHPAIIHGQPCVHTCQHGFELQGATYEMDVHGALPEDKQITKYWLGVVKIIYQVHKIHAQPIFAYDVFLYFVILSGPGTGLGPQ